MKGIKDFEFDVSRIDDIDYKYTCPEFTGLESFFYNQSVCRNLENTQKLMKLSIEKYNKLQKLSKENFYTNINRIITDIHSPDILRSPSLDENDNSTIKNDNESILNMYTKLLDEICEIRRLKHEIILYKKIIRESNKKIKKFSWF